MSSFDPVELNDPKSPRPHDETPFELGWGFCQRCAFLVPVTDDVLTEHRYTRNGPADVFCTGSFRAPTTPVPFFAEPLKQISLKKDSNRAGRRAYWQMRRWRSRAGEEDSPSPASTFARLWLGGAASQGVVDDYGEQHYGDHTD